MGWGLCDRSMLTEVRVRDDTVPRLAIVFTHSFHVPRRGGIWPAGMWHQVSCTGLVLEAGSLGYWGDATSSLGPTQHRREQWERAWRAWQWSSHTLAFFFFYFWVVRLPPALEGEPRTHLQPKSERDKVGTWGKQSGVRVAS